jgi:hypothetical protein
MVDHNTDRRAGERYDARFPGYVQLSDGIRRIAIIRDLSSSGVRLLMDAAAVQPGEQVSLQLHIGSDPEDFCAAAGRVVRVEPLDAGLWNTSVAVTFDAPLAMTDEDIARFNEVPPSLQPGPDDPP